MGLDVTALDLDPPLFQSEIERLPAGSWTFRKAPDASTLPFEDSSFDLVLSIGVLEHVRDTGGTEEASLSEIHRVLHPDGTFICYHLPNQRSWIEFVARRSDERHSHNQRFNEKEIANLFSRAKLQIHRIQRYGLLPRNEASRLPGSSTTRVADTFDAIDRVLERLIPLLAQNFIVLAKPAGDNR